ncbi:hypothetical protein ACQP2Y_13465 [Actinoplanes sp. CA-051413]|uniref:hypothetical protein n=1 Tax=Actinoplanes sp. CA-051413 TaxID=3239899 RepID=UPI003D956688
MFSAGDRDSIRGRLLDLADRDPAVVGAAITGSEAVGSGDRWSDIDLAFGIDGSVDEAMRRWTDSLYDDFAAVHHWDLSSGPTTYRVFLLAGLLEVDLAFTPSADFGPRGPSWRTVFGDPAVSFPAAVPDRDTLAGLAWHHALHARVCLQRGRLWQAEHWIGALRGQVIALACVRLGLPASNAKGAHLLPAEVTSSLAATLVRTLDHAELHRALQAAAIALAAEFERTDPALFARLDPVLTELRVSGRR